MFFLLVMIAGLVAVGFGAARLLSRAQGGRVVPLLLIIGGLLIALVAGSIEWYFLRNMIGGQVYTYVDE